MLVMSVSCTGKQKTVKERQAHLGNMSKAVGMEQLCTGQVTQLLFASVYRFTIEIITPWFGDDYGNLIRSYVAEKYLGSINVHPDLSEMQILSPGV